MSYSVINTKYTSGEKNPYSLNRSTLAVLELYPMCPCSHTGRKMHADGKDFLSFVLQFISVAK